MDIEPEFKVGQRVYVDDTAMPGFPRNRRHAQPCIVATIMDWGEVNRDYGPNPYRFYYQVVFADGSLLWYNSVNLSTAKPGPTDE